MKYLHVDVFTNKPLAGNGLTVVFPDTQLNDSVLLKIAQELKQFETTFVFPKKGNSYPVRIFTVQEELSFAGHPLLGTAAVLHSLELSTHTKSDSTFNSTSTTSKYDSTFDACNSLIRLNLSGRIIELTSVKNDKFFSVTMNQGKAQFLQTLTDSERIEAASWFSLTKNDIQNDYPMSVVSTGLPYLLVPVSGCLEKIKIRVPDLENRLQKFGAKFAYFFDPNTLECRTWDNSGLYEDVATGSAAGPLISYLVKNNYKKHNTEVILKQGRFLERDSSITGIVDDNECVFIKGDVAFFAEGILK